jgi:hypothetical protein
MVRIRAVHAAALCLAILSSSTVSAFVPSRLSMPHLRLSKSARNRAGPALLPRMCVRGEGNESRRAILLRCSATVATSLGAGLLGPRQSSADEAPVELKANKAYNGPSAYGFKFKYPKSWKPNKQVGNAHLYNLQVTSGKEGGGGRIALTVDQIKANSLKDWSSLEAACERLKANLGRSSKNGGATSVVSQESNCFLLNIAPGTTPGLPLSLRSNRGGPGAIEGVLEGRDDLLRDCGKERIRCSATTVYRLLK